MLQSVNELLQAEVIGCCLVPETRVPGVRDHLDSGVSDASHLLLNDGWFDDCIVDAMCNQHRLSKLGQEVVIVKRAGEEGPPYIGRNPGAIPQHQIVVCGADF